MRTNLSIVFGIIATILIGIGAGNHDAYAAKLKASSYSDGYSSGVKDASRDLQGLNGHGYDRSCPSGHTSVFCDGYVRGYDATWSRGRVSSSPPPSQAPSEGQKQRATIVSSCFQNKGQAWEKGYNDAQNDYKAGNAFSDILRSISPFDNYKAGYSQGYIDARDGLYQLC